jgi:hypothetical protein
MPIAVATNKTSTDRFFGGGPGLPPVLLNHPTQSDVPIDGWKSILFGLPFFLSGLLIEAAAFDFIPVHGKHAPTWMLSLIGMLFGSAGLFLIAHGVLGLIRQAAHEREAAQFPGQPWYSDYHWHREGFAFSAFTPWSVASSPPWFGPPSSCPFSGSGCRNGALPESSSPCPSFSACSV